MAPPRGAPRPAADAAGDDQPRPDQLQHADQQPLRQPRLRPGAGGDRQGVPHLPAAAGDLLGGDRHGALPDPGPLRDPRRDRQPAGDDGQRDAADPLRPAARRRRRARPLRADDPARLPARRLRPQRRRRWSRRPSSGSPSRCRPTASTCSRPAPSSASSGPGWRPASRWSTSSSRPSPPLALYEPFGVGGIVAGTGIGTTVAAVAQAVILRREFGGLELRRLLSTSLRITLASARPRRGLLRRLGRPRPRPRTRPGRPDRLPGAAASVVGGAVYLGASPSCSGSPSWSR